MSPEAAFIPNPDVGSARPKARATVTIDQAGLVVIPGDVERKPVVQASAATLARAAVSMQTDETFESTHLLDNFA